MCWRRYPALVKIPTAAATSKSRACLINRCRCLVSILTAASLAAPAPAAIIRHDVPVQAYADLAQQPVYDSVGRYVVNGTTLVASGVLVHPEWVLTATHVLEYGASDPHTFEIGGNVHTVGERIYFAPWSGQPSDYLNGLDYALVRLDTPVIGVTPATRYRGTAELGRIATIVGNGFFGDGLNGVTGGNMRLAYNNVLDRNLADFGYSNRVLLADFDNPLNPADSSMGSTTPLNLEGGISHGDSGGGWFASIDGQTQLVGITSFAFRPNGDPYTSRYGDVLAMARVTSVNDWIDSVIPEPSTLTLVAATLVLVSIRRGCGALLGAR
ncbi:MAG: hypothetical protein CHACPFDD_00414 [Phycisphaerae bacterium]|nr:hypothetical protein [Phycisphaerae bacterium]